MKSARIDYNKFENQWCLWLRGDDDEDWMWIQTWNVLGPIGKVKESVSWMSETVIRTIAELQECGFEVTVTV